MALQGNLSDIPAQDLLEIITRKGKNGILRFSHNNGSCQGSVLVYQSELFAAFSFTTTLLVKALKYSGEDVIHLLLSAEEAEFIFEPLPSNFNLPVRNISATKQQISLAHLFRGADFSIEPNQPKTAAAPVPQRKYEAPRPGFGLSRNNLAYSGGSAAYAASARPTQPANQAKRGWISSVVNRLRSL